MFHFWSYCVKNVLFLFSFVSLPSLGVDLNIWLKYNERHRRQTGPRWTETKILTARVPIIDLPLTQSLISINSK